MFQKRAEPIKVKDLILKGLFSRYGILLKALTGFIMWGISYLFIIVLGIPFEPSTITHISEAVGAIVFIVLQWLALKINLTATEEIQNQIKDFDPNVEPDRWLGPVTKEAIIKASEIAKNKVYKAEVIEEPEEVN